MPPPVTGEAAPKKSSSKKKGTLKLSQVITTGLIESYHAQFLRVRLELIRSGADVIRSSPDDTVALILQRLEQLRHGRIRR
jgi:hypothetical protein